MTREEAIVMQKSMRDNLHETGKDYPYRDDMIPLMKESCDMAIKALEPKPMQKFDNVKQHIDRLAGDYKCWDERLSHEEALELSKMLEQEPVLDKIKNEIKDNTYFINETTEKEGIDFETVEKIIDKYKAERRDKE